jgi:phosphocarrier protein
MDEVTATRAVIVMNAHGLHARPADRFVRLACQFAAEVFVTKDSIRVNGKSMLDMLTLAAEKGSRLVLEATGSDAHAAVDALARLVEAQFGDYELTTDPP